MQTIKTIIKKLQENKNIKMKIIYKVQLQTSQTI